MMLDDVSELLDVDMDGVSFLAHFGDNEDVEAPLGTILEELRDNLRLDDLRIRDNGEPSVDDLPSTVVLFSASNACTDEDNNLVDTLSRGDFDFADWLEFSLGSLRRAVASIMDFADLGAFGTPDGRLGGDFAAAAADVDFFGSADEALFNGDDNDSFRDEPVDSVRRASHLADGVLDASDNDDEVARGT